MPSLPSLPFLLDLLRLAMRKEAAALYVVPWMPPTLRMDERSVPLSSTAFAPEQSTLLVMNLLDEAQRQALNISREIQFTLELPDVGRFRVHAFRRHGQPAMAIRPYTAHLLLPRQLGLPPLVANAALAGRGLLVLAGRSASLRQAAAAALVEHRNRQGQGEVLVLEDASRCWHDSQRCRLQQGVTPGQVMERLQRRAGAVGGAPLLAIAWGELRDGPQLERAVRSAERALCIVTLAADTMAGALQRLVDLAAESNPDAPGNHRPEGGRPAGTWFEPGHPDALHRCAIALHTLVLLRPVPAADGGHDLAAAEWLVNSPELAADLAEADFGALGRHLAPGGHTPDADAHLAQLVAQQRVHPDDALRHARDHDSLARRVMAAADSSAGPGDEPTPVRPGPGPSTGLNPMPTAPGTPPATGADHTASARPAAIDTGFADLFEHSAPAPDPFGFADESAAPPTGTTTDTQFDNVGWQASGAGGATPPGGATGRALAPGSRSAHPGAVQFHAHAPRAVVPGTTVAVDIWAALPAQADELATCQRNATGEPEPPPPLPGSGTPVTLQLRVDGLLRSAQQQVLLWQQQPVRARFAVPVPVAAPAGPHAVRVRLVVAGLGIGELSFVLNVMPNALPHGPLGDAHAARRMLHSAYAAYATADRASVLQRLHTLHQVAPGLDVFVDAPQLRTAPAWRDRIQHELGRRERLFLFWSATAAESPWIDFEWRLVLRTRGPAALDAVLLQPPRDAPLPAELADLADPAVHREGRQAPDGHDAAGAGAGA